MIGALPPKRAINVVAALAILVSVAVGFMFLVVAMSMYPGGTAFEATSAGHSFWFNFFCDLTNSVAVNGQPNKTGARCARVALIWFGVALGCFWLLVPASFGPGCGRRLAWLIRATGITSVGALLTVPLAEGSAHVVAVFASSVPALVAGLLALVGTFRYSRSAALVTLSAATVLASAVDAVLYARSYLAQPRVVVPALPLFQRLALLLMLLWMVLVAVRVLTVGRPQGHSGTKR